MNDIPLHMLAACSLVEILLRPQAGRMCVVLESRVGLAGEATALRSGANSLLAWLGRQSSHLTWCSVLEYSVG